MYALYANGKDEWTISVFVNSKFHVMDHQNQN